MIRSVPTRLALVAALALSLPAATVAQDATPEGIDWQLTQYLDGAEMTAVPWDVDASLRLDQGEAKGSAGCNGFGASYVLDGEDLTFSAPGSTLMGCADSQMAVEAAYLAALPEVATWSMATVGEWQILMLQDDSGENLLRFEIAALGLTRSDLRALAAELAALRTEVDRHDERIDDIRVATLRERIKALEAQVQELSGEAPDTSALNAAERVLLEAIPAAFADSCVPRRTDNPTGTVAALQCQPDDPVVRDMAYYLMGDDRAWRTWRQRMREWAVPGDSRGCWRGQPGISVATGSLDTAGCYVDANGRANLRYATEATICRQLDAGKTHLKRPAIYIAVLGEDDDIAALTRWAEPREWAGARDLVVPIDRPDAKWDPSCPR